MNLASGIKANVYGMVLNTGASLAANIVMARYFLAQDFGIFNFITSNLTILVLVLSLNMDAAVSYALVQKSVPKAGLATVIFLLIPIVLLVVFLIVYFLPFQTGFFNHGLLLGFSLLFVAGNLCVNFSLPFYQAQGMYKRATSAGFVFNACLCLAGIAFLWLDRQHGHLKLFVLSYGLLYFLYGLILCAAPLKETIAAEFSIPDKAALKPVFKYAVSALAANVLFLLVYRMDFWFVKAFCSDADLGNYIQASKLGQLFLLIPTFIATPVFFSSGAVAGDAPPPALARLTRWVFILNSGLMALALLLGYSLFEVVYGRTFINIFPCLLGLAIGIIALSVNRIICAFWAKVGLVRFNIIGNAVALFVIMLLDAVFIRRWGIQAAAVISSIGYVLFLAFNLWMLKQRYQVSLLLFFIPQRSDMAFLKTRLSGSV